MMLISDDPIVRSIEMTGYPPWISTDYGEDEEFYDDGDEIYYGNNTMSF